METFEDFWFVEPTGLVPPNGREHEHYFAHFRHHSHVPLLLRREHFIRGTHTNYDRHLDFYALYLVRGGSGIHRIDGIPYGLARGDVYLMPPGTRHAYENWENLEIDAFYFPPTLLDDAETAALRDLPGFWGLFLRASQTNHRLHLTPETWRPFEENVLELRAEYLSEESVAALLLRQGVFRLLVHLGRQTRQNNGSHATPSPTWASLLSWMEENCAQPLSVGQLAARAFLSPGHFNKLFIQQTGQTPAAHLRRLRLEKARALLREGRLSITQIAQESGFGDAAHFSRTFKAFYGTSPSEFRRLAP